MNRDNKNGRWCFEKSCHRAYCVSTYCGRRILHKKYQENEETVGDVQEVKWDVSNGKGNEKVDIVFQLLNNKNNEIRGVNDRMRAVIVDGQLKNIQQIKPTFAGTGHISYLPK